MISTLTHKALQENLKHISIAKLQIKQTHGECVILSTLPPWMFSVLFVLFFCQIGEYYLLLSWSKVSMSYIMFISEKQVLHIGYRVRNARKNTFKNGKVVSLDLKEGVKKIVKLIVSIWILLMVFIAICSIFPSGISNVN